MAAGRSMKSLVGRRRRPGEEGEDEEGSVMVVDSQSEGSVPSDLEDEAVDGSSVEDPSLGGADADADASRGKAEMAMGAGKAAGKKARKSRKKGSKKQGKEMISEPVSANNNGFKAMADTEAMMNGLKLDDSAPETMDFENMHANGSAISALPPQQIPGVNGNGYVDGLNERHKREHEDARRKRDANPAFIPSRGNFFMHDTRMQNSQGNTSGRGAWSGRGRGRGAANGSGPSAPLNPHAQSERAAEQTWKHDLHEAINEELNPATGTQKAGGVLREQEDSARMSSKPFPPGQNHGPRVQSFSTTTKVGTVQIRVCLPQMKAPITFSEVPWKQYTRLPDHRPPLRRDKPVRISLPEHVQRYIFPSPERSFIFIPRQMRPNQQGFGRYSYQRSAGGYGYSSRRTSMYGGSMYAASVAASRRSSFASVARENAFSPVAGNVQAARPIVRLPHGQHHHYSSSSTPMGALSGQQTPTGMQVHTFPLPQQPTYQGTPSTMVHQPRPQKAISVTGIESPAILQQTPTAQEAQPFQNQLPSHLNEQLAYTQVPPYQSPGQLYSYPPQPQAGTPLSGIPEQAVHASAFQPPNIPYGQVPYFPTYPQQGYYYPPAPPHGYQHMPMYMPPPQGYMMSPPAPVVPSQQAPPPPAMPQVASQPMDGEAHRSLQAFQQQPQQQQQQQSQPPSQPRSHSQNESQSQSQSGMVAHESNGMVFYLPASEAQQQPHGDTFQPAESFVPSYAMPGLPPPTPAPEAPYYYPPQISMPGLSHTMYYPPQAQQ